MVFVIEINNLLKDYGSVRALDHLDLTIPRGVCFGILGPNGAGKTTLLEILEGIREKTSGNVKIFGCDIERHIKTIQPRLGVQLQENNFFSFINIRQLLIFFLNLYPDSPYRVDELLSMVGLEGSEKQPYKNLSGGQKQRFSIAVSLVNDADLLFFDEPTTGLDPQNRRFVWDLINEQKRKKKSIILTTHYMEEAEVLCDDIAIVEKGNVLIRGTPEQLKKTIKGDISISFETEGGVLDIADINQIKGIGQKVQIKDSGGWRLWSEHFLDTIQSTYEVAEDKGLQIKNLELEKITLEDVFLNLTGKELRD